MSRVSDAVESLTAAMRDRRPDESVTGVLRRWLLTTQTEPEDREQRLLARRMFAANQQLAALRTARMTAVLRQGAAAIAAETGADADAIGPRIAAAAASAIVAEILDTEPGPRRQEAVAAATRFIEAGIAAL
jgi:hypothetical protein